MKAGPLKTVLREATLLLLAACFALGSALASLPMHAHAAKGAASQGVTLSDKPCIASASVHLADSKTDLSDVDRGDPDGGPCLNCLCTPSNAQTAALPAASHALRFVHLSLPRAVVFDAPLFTLQGLPPARGPPLTI